MTSESVPSKSFYYKALQKSFTRLFDKSSAECHTFLVPVLASLPQKIDRDFIKTHILTPSPYFKDEFVTLDGKTVAVKEGKVMCRQGFRYPRNVQVVAEETCYSDNFESFKLILVASPLVGRIRARAQTPKTVNIPEKLSIGRKKLRDHQRFVASRMDSKSYKSFIRGLNDYISHFRQSYVIVKGFVDDAAQKCKSRCKTLLDKLLHQKNVDRAYQEALLGSECLLLDALYTKIFKGICTLYSEEDQSLCNCVANFQKLDLKNRIGVRADLSFDPEDAIAQLKMLNGKRCSTPLAKLMCLYDAQEQLSKAVSNKLGSGEVLAADDMLPLLAYIIALSGDQRWCSNLEYLKNFAPDSKILSALDAGNLGYQMANFQAAIDLLKEVTKEDSQDLTPSNKEHVESPVDTKVLSSQDLKLHHHGEKSSSTRLQHQRRNSSIREGGSSARARALRRLRKQEAEKKKADIRPRRSKYKDEIDRALLQIGISARGTDEVLRTRSNEGDSRHSLVHTLLAQDKQVFSGRNKDSR
mmetsp:Transcript_21266/g.52036  ORF Transcript_21266/g.52036 Transcript_21266/m.52036 type:complete len:526 (+) Transcript_21266:104-1681(+)